MHKAIRFLSRRNWGILRYNSALQNMVALFYLCLEERLFSTNFLARVGLFFLFSLLMTGYGYFINDLADIDLDREHGKQNAFSNIDWRRASLIVLAMLAAGLLPAIPFLRKPDFTVGLVLWILTATFYSLPPLRLKERGLIGLAATIAAQQTLPAFLLFAALGQKWEWGWLVFILFATFRGISSDVSHQMREWDQDSRTGTATFAVQVGFERVKQVYAFSLELERITLGAVLLVMLLRLPEMTLPWGGLVVSPVWPLLVIYLILLVLTAGRSWMALRLGELVMRDPYDEMRQKRQADALHLIHHTFPSVLVPLYLALWASWLYWPNIVFVIIIIFLFRLYRPELWIRVFTSLKDQARQLGGNTAHPAREPKER
jgi:4-hydroxybenzoate polyprenyltransferase